MRKSLKRSTWTALATLVGIGVVVLASSGAAQTASPPAAAPAIEGSESRPSIPAVPERSDAEEQEDRLRIRLANGWQFSYPVDYWGVGRYISTTNLTALLRAVDRDAEIYPDISTGVFRARVGGRDVSLFRDQNRMTLDSAIVVTDDRLIAGRGQVYVPLSSVELILRGFPSVKTNIEELLVASHSPVASLDVESKSPVAPVVEDDAPVVAPPSGAENRMQVPAITPAPTQSPARADWHKAAAGVAARRAVVIDPLPMPVSAGAGPSDLALRIARLCQQKLEGNPSLRVVLTRSSPGARPSRDERLAVANRAEAKAFLSIGIDSSPLAENAGYRLYAPHDAVDPDALRATAVSSASDSAQREALFYLPYQEIGITLARLLDGEMARSGLAPAPDKLHLAPFYMLKRVGMPAVSVSLGYWSNPTDRARMERDDYAQTAADCLAQALLRYNDWLGDFAAGGAR